MILFYQSSPDEGVLWHTPHNLLEQNDGLHKTKHAVNFIPSDPVIGNSHENSNNHDNSSRKSSALQRHSKSKLLHSIVNGSATGVIPDDSAELQRDGWNKSGGSALDEPEQSVRKQLSKVTSQ